MTIAACANETPLTCDQKKAQELVDADRAFTRFCDEATISDLLQLFFKPFWATDSPDQQAALVNYLTRHAICHPQNNALTACVGDDPCDDPQPTFCPDPDECPSKFYGYGLLEVIRSAIRADSMTRLPIKSLGSIASGEALVWDPTAVPDNSDCDPCTADVLGAFVPQHVYDTAHPGG